MFSFSGFSYCMSKGNWRRNICFVVSLGKGNYNNPTQSVQEN